MPFEPECPAGYVTRDAPLRASAQLTIDTKINRHFRNDNHRQRAQEERESAQDKLGHRHAVIQNERNGTGAFYGDIERLCRFLIKHKPYILHLRIPNIPGPVRGDFDFSLSVGNHPIQPVLLSEAFSATLTKFTTRQSAHADALLADEIVTPGSCSINSPPPLPAVSGSL